MELQPTICYGSSQGDKVHLTLHFNLPRDGLSVKLDSNISVIEINIMPVCKLLK